MEDVENLIDTLALERIEVNLFRGLAPTGQGPRIFGGLVIGQALLAAYRTVEGRLCHSLHCYFIRPGDPAVPILFEVDRARDGRSFATRRVIAIQHGQQIFNLAASFQVPEEGLEHQDPMPDVPAPETLPSEPGWGGRFRLPTCSVRENGPGTIQADFPDPPGLSPARWPLCFAANEPS